MPWTELRKGGTLLHVEYGLTFTNNLYAHDVRVRTEPKIELSVSLDPNLRTRNKTTDSYEDARDLADGRISEMKLVQLSDEYIIDRLGRVLGHLDEIPSEWTLAIELEGSHTFTVRPEYDAAGRGSLSLNVVH